MAKFQWFDDNERYRLPVEGGEDLILTDAYSQWLLGPGADFDLTEELKSPGSDAADFTYVTEIRSLSGKMRKPIKPGPAQPTALSARVSGIALPFADDPGGPSVPEVPASSLVVKLPIRTSGVANGDRLQEDPPAYRRPAELEPARAVIIGVIDDSINIAHERFQHLADDKLSSRIDYAWIQDADAPAGDTTVPYGREWTRADIDGALAAHGDDAEGLMRALDLVGDPARPHRPSPLRLRASHGTHVADLAAGYAPDDAAGLHRRLIAVQLPAIASQDTSGASLIATIFNAIAYLFERAVLISVELKTAVPVIVNFSYGFGGGARNSHHIIERALIVQALWYRKDLAELGLAGSDTVPVEIVMPAGNMHLARNHAVTERATTTTELTLDVGLRLQPDDLTASYVEIWMPKHANGILLTITAPTGEKQSFKPPSEPASGPDSEPLSFGRVLALPAKAAGGVPAEPDRATIVARIKRDEPNNLPQAMRDEGLHAVRFLFAFAPTAVLDKKRLAAPHGRWQITATASVPRRTRIEAWIQRDESVSGLGRRGRQAYFDDPAYEASRFDRLGDVAVADTASTVVRRDGTLSGIATGSPREILGAEGDRIGVTAVGGYRWRDGGAALYSAAGLAAEASQNNGKAEAGIVPAPLALAPSDTSRALPGIIAAGSRSGSRTAFNGTSVAAPQIVRRFADELVDHPSRRGAFKGSDLLANICQPAPRPGRDGTELATGTAIRLDRTRLGLVPMLPAHETGIVRAGG